MWNVSELDDGLIYNPFHLIVESVESLTASLFNLVNFGGLIIIINLDLIESCVLLWHRLIDSHTMVTLSTTPLRLS